MSPRAPVVRSRVWEHKMILPLWLGISKDCGGSPHQAHVYKGRIYSTISRLDRQALLRWAVLLRNILDPILQIQWPRIHLPLPSSLLLSRGRGDWTNLRKPRKGRPLPSIMTLLIKVPLRMTHLTTSTRLPPLRRSSSSIQFPPPGSGCPQASGSISSSASSVRCYPPRSASHRA